MDKPGKYLGNSTKFSSARNIKAEICAKYCFQFAIDLASVLARKKNKILQPHEYQSWKIIRKSRNQHKEQKMKGKWEKYQVQKKKLAEYQVTQKNRHHRKEQQQKRTATKKNRQKRTDITQKNRHQIKEEQQKTTLQEYKSLIKQQTSVKRTKNKRKQQKYQSPKK